MVLICSPTSKFTQIPPSLPFRPFPRFDRGSLITVPHPLDFVPPCRQTLSLGNSFVLSLAQIAPKCAPIHRAVLRLHVCLCHPEWNTYLCWASESLTATYQYHFIPQSYGGRRVLEPCSVLRFRSRCPVLVRSWRASTRTNIGNAKDPKAVSCKRNLYLSCLVSLFKDWRNHWWRERLYLTYMLHSFWALYLTEFMANNRHNN